MISQLCVYCNKDTSFGSGRFVNRIPSDGDGTQDWDDPDLRGYACAECMALPCDRCDKNIPLDEDLTPNCIGMDGSFADGAYRVHEECLTEKESGQLEDHY